MLYEYVKVQEQGKILIVTMNRPEVYNAMHPPFHCEMETIWNNFSKNNDLWVGILTGAGNKAFSTGNDLKYTSKGGKGLANKTGAAGLTMRFDLEKPIIAAVNGFAMGGGLETALACDFLIASENAIFALPEVKVGFIAAAGGIQRLMRQIGRAAALDMLYTGRNVGAQEALKLGIVSQVVSQSELMSMAMAKAEEIISVSPSAVRATKRVLNSVDKGSDLEKGLIYSKKVVDELKETVDFKEGVNAFVEKRKPNWKNR
jgi:crotonobetainyl-CoA hydratase